MLTIHVDADDRAAGGLTREHLDTALHALRTDGFVVLADAVDTAHVDVLHDRMLRDLEQLRARPDVPYNWNTGNVQQDPPPFPPYLFTDILLNEHVIAISSALLGPSVRNVLYAGNTAVTSDERQPVHADSGHLWPSDMLDVAHPPAELVINVPTVDVSPDNGATEIWPGTHLELGVSRGQDIKVAQELLEKRRAVSPPFQPTLRRGSVLIRDVRLWHAGMPNRTPNPRPMIAMVHACGWLAGGKPLTFPTETRSFFDHPVLAMHARFTDEPIDHISAPQGFEFDPSSAA